MPEHDLVEEEDGAVRCRCGRWFMDTTTEEAKARYRVHFRAETIGKPGVAEARAALKGETDGS